jgi:hypothetical protein
MYEPDEIFTVVLSNAKNAFVADSQGDATITNDDSQPAIRIGDVSKSEGASGTTAFVFTVTLSNTSCQTVTMNYATADGTATAGSDYTAASGTLTFGPGELSKMITVLVKGDRLKEANESFYLNLTGATDAIFADPQALATILNDDA